MYRKTGAHLSRLEANPSFHASGGGCLFVTPQAKWLFLMMHEAGACFLFSSKIDLYLFYKASIYLSCPIRQTLTSMFAKQIFVYYAPRGGFLFSMNANWILIYYHGFRSRSLLHSVRPMLIFLILREEDTYSSKQVLIYYASRSRCLSPILCQVDVCLLCSTRRSIFFYTPRGGSLLCPWGECMSLTPRAMSCIPSFMRKWNLYPSDIPL